MLATLQKVTLLHECYSDFSNCANDTKYSNASFIIIFGILQQFLQT